MKALREKLLYPRKERGWICHGDGTNPASRYVILRLDSSPISVAE